MKRNGHEWLWHDLVQAMRSRYVRCKSLRWTGRHYETGRLTLCGPQINELAFISIQCHFKDASIIFEKKRWTENAEKISLLGEKKTPLPKREEKKKIFERQIKFLNDCLWKHFFFLFFFALKDQSFDLSFILGENHSRMTK